MAGFYLPGALSRSVNAQFAKMFASGAADIDFTAPLGEDAKYPAGSFPWRLYKNPVVSFIGGISGVYLQLGEPRVRTGVWEHSSFRKNAVTRIRRTGAAGMLSVYGPKSQADKVSEYVNKMHDNIKGVTACGKPYYANDPELLSWVFNTVTSGLVRAHHNYGTAFSEDEIAEGYSLIGEVRETGTHSFFIPRSGDEMHSYFQGMLKSLEGGEVIDEFTDIMRNAELMPTALRPLQRLLLRAAVSNIPSDFRDQIGLDAKYGLRPGEKSLVTMLCKISDKIILEGHPAVQSSVRMGLPPDYLFKRHPSNDNSSEFEPLVGFVTVPEMDEPK